MTLDLNAKAPIFDVKDIYGKQVDLEAYRGKKVFVGFFRHAGCPFCNLRVHTLIKIREELKQNNMEMIFFFESKEEVLLISTFHQEVSPIPLISDPQKIWYDAYGIEDSSKKSTMGHITSFAKSAVQAKLKGLPMHLMADGESYGTMPAEFILDEDLIIRKLHYSQKLSDRLDLKELLHFAQHKLVSI